jgi:signal transduction histidine kinase
MERFAYLTETQGYHFHVDVDEGLYTTADELKIGQVLYNLIGNAVNYTGEDKTVVIRQTVLRENGTETVLAEVIDTGIGISSEDLPLVWERYYKVNDFHKRANMGTGLGLSIVKNILLLHGAEFGVNSRPGQGSNFWFKLKTTE